MPYQKNLLMFCLVTLQFTFNIQNSAEGNDVLTLANQNHLLVPVR